VYTTEELRRLNPERLELLAGELDSGKYLKGEHRLATKDTDGVWRHCCMGVGSEVAIANGLDIPVGIQDMSNPGEQPWFRKHFARNTGVFPREVTDWFGFTDDNPDLPYKGQFISMASWNDRGPVEEGQPPEPDFTTIAAALRELAQMAREARDAEAGS